MCQAWNVEVTFFFFLKIYICERERASKRAHSSGGRGRGKDSPADCPLSTEPNKGLDSMTLKSGPEPKPRDAELTSYPVAPRGGFLVKLMNFELHSCLFSWAPSKV